MKINNKTLRDNIGKTLQWEDCHDRHRRTCFIRSGIIEECTGKNVLINGDYKWYPSLINAKILSDNSKADSD